MLILPSFTFAEGVVKSIKVINPPFVRVITVHAILRVGAFPFRISVGGSRQSLNSFEGGRCENTTGCASIVDEWPLRNLMIILPHVHSQSTTLHTTQGTQQKAE